MDSKNKDTASALDEERKLGNVEKRYLPKARLTQGSPFFCAPLNGRLAEANPNPLSSSEDEPAIFELFIQWLYLGLFNHTGQGLSLRDRIGCTPFRYLVMLHLIKIHHDDLSMTPTTLRLAYELSPPDSKLRDWAFNQFMLDPTCGHIKYAAKDWGELARILNDFSSDLARSLARGKADKDSFENANPYLENPLGATGGAASWEFAKREVKGWLNLCLYTTSISGSCSIEHEEDEEVVEGLLPGSRLEA